MRVLIASHSHPEASNGGAETAAFQLFCALQAEEDCRVRFLGCDREAGPDRTGAVLTQPKFANRAPPFPVGNSVALAHLLRQLEIGRDVSRRSKAAVYPQLGFRFQEPVP